MDVIYYQTKEGHYPVKEFLDTLSVGHQSKVFAYFDMLSIAGNELRMPYSRYLNEGIFELRPSRDGLSLRILYFFDQDKAILTNGFLKKTKKTPSTEIARAKKYRRDYCVRKGQ